MDDILPIISIVDLLEVGNKFIFEVGSDNPTKHLRKITKNVPNLPGLYLVFSEKRNDFEEKSHLYFILENWELELVYYGKAGGVTKDGKILKQNLVGRINNVVNGDVPRAIYWNNEMLENNENALIIYYQIFENPSQIEKGIYNFLDVNSLSYPRMNKKLGRKNTR